jgi:DNA primase
VVAAHPDEVTMEWRIPKRTGKMFIDHNMNGSIDPSAFRVATAEKMEGMTDPWAGILKLEQSIEQAVGSVGPA